MTVRVTLTSFGIKYRRCPAANLVFDGRVLDNPADVDELRPLTGLDPVVARYVLDQELALEIVDVLMAAIVLQLQKTDRPPVDEVRVAIFCTGGKHRSVAVVEELADNLRPARPDVVVVTEHLDLRTGREDPRRSIAPDDVW
ncbi:P-loop ATPase family protein [Lentzea atacamensis]|uniref:P-loop ATPase family protein n=1 Tax=Lentzea atacamensis TaxID=531938 RepID=A0ABX9DZB9_9PSEU|nr:RNase adapter RapZ [Lentzea atacamensis]RAS59567.1 P-loop ATPase family protein [Lentzea atacamensis]